MKIFIQWFISAIAILLAAYLLPGVHIAGFVAALILAVILGAINGLLRPLLILLTLPLTIVTFGIFLLILNTLLIMLAAAIAPGFAVDGFWWAFLFSVVLTCINTVLFGMLDN